MEKNRRQGKGFINASYCKVTPSDKKESVTLGLQEESEPELTRENYVTLIEILRETLIRRAVDFQRTGLSMASCRNYYNDLIQSEIFDILVELCSGRRQYLLDDLKMDLRLALGVNI